MSLDWSREGEGGGVDSSGRARGYGSAKNGLGPGHGGVNHKTNLSEINGLLQKEAEATQKGREEPGKRACHPWETND